jgi:hypothetical protein
MSVRDEIRKHTRLARIRMGQEAPEMETIPSMPEVRVALVPLSERESIQAQIAAASLEVPDNMAGVQARQRTAVHWDVWNACREPGDFSQKVWASVDDMLNGEGGLEPHDVDVLFDRLTVLMDYASPAHDGISDADLADLKNRFALIDWNGLTGRRWSALKLCLSILSPELLLANSPSTTSTSSSTEKNESDESI